MMKPRMTVRCLVFLGLFIFVSPVCLSQKPELVVQTGHFSFIHSVAFSADGKTVASGSQDSTIKLWDVGTGRELRTLSGHSDLVNSVAFSPDGKTLASSSKDNTIKLWDVSTGRELRTLTRDSNLVREEIKWQPFPLLQGNSVAFSPDGKTLASGSLDDTIKLWEVGTGRELRTLTGHTSEVLSVAFSPDGKTLASGSLDDTIKLWEVGTGRELRTLTGHSEGVTSVAFSGDGKTVASGSWDTTIKLWDVETGRVLRTLRYSMVSSVAFSPDGKTLASSGNNDRTIKLWEVATGRELRTLTGHSAQVASIAFSADGKTLASGSWDKTIKLWEVVTGRELRTLIGHSGSVSSVAFSPDGKTLAGGGLDKTIKLWDVVTGRELRTITGHTSEVLSVAFSADGKTLASVSLDATIKLWEVAAGSELRTLRGHSERVNSVAFSADGKTLASGSLDDTIKLWEVATGRELRTLTGHSDSVDSVAFNADGKTLASGSYDKTIKLWEAATGRELRTLTGHSDYVASVAFSPDGKTLASGSVDKTIKLWDVATGRVLRTLSGHSTQITSVAFSADRKMLASGSSDNTIKLWEVSTGRELRTLRHSGFVRSVTFSADGQFLVSGGSGTSKLWRVAGGELAASLIALDKADWAIVAPDGRFDASPAAFDLMHYIYGLEIISFEQMKDAYYEPGLLSKLLGFNKEPLRQIRPLKDVKLYPEILERRLDPASARLTVKLKNRGGGIGRVLVSVNGKTVVEDARDEQLKVDPFVAEAVITIDLKGSPFTAGKENVITVITNNYDPETKNAYISSRGAELVFVPEGETKTEPPTLFAIVGGVSDYAGAALHLRFSAKDAEDFATALRLGSKRLFGAKKTHVTVLSTSKGEGTAWPSKNNFKAAFAEVAKLAKPEDVFVIYLAGHGVSLGLNADTYLYLTQEATSTSSESLSNPDTRETTAISSAELIRWLAQTEWVAGEKGIKALKQVMILDTCAAGTVAGSLPLITRRELSSDQIRAIERLKDRTGFHVLMGSAADAPSYEVTQYGQGLLTHALLQGMRGAALRDGEFIDVQKLFQYAADEVRLLAKNIGGVQRPIVAAPSGTSFDVGQLNEGDRRLVPLALVKPLILRPRFLDAQAADPLDLVKTLRSYLRDESFVTGRTASEGSLVFVDDDEFPGAITPSGIYTVEGNKVTVVLHLRRDGVEIARAQVTGTKDDLAANLMEAIKAAIRNLAANLMEAIKAAIR